MRHLLVTTLWFACGCLLTGVIADTMQHRAEAAPIDLTMALHTGAAPGGVTQVAALPRGTNGREALQAR